MKNLIKIALLCVLAVPGMVYSQENKEVAAATSSVEIGELKKAVELHPDDLKAHEAYIEAVGGTRTQFYKNVPLLEKQYAIWIKKYPRIANVPFALGKELQNEELPEAKKYLLKAVELNPKLEEAYYALYLDAKRWGQFPLSMEYIKKASEVNPESSEYAFTYAYAFLNVDKAKFRTEMMNVVKQFPTGKQGGSYALNSLIDNTKDNEDRIKLFELTRKDFAKGNSGSFSFIMEKYFSVLLKMDLQKAIILAKEMSGNAEIAKDNDETEKKWPMLLKLAQQLEKAKTFMGAKNGEEALAALNQIRLPKYYKFSELEVLKAEANVIAGKAAIAYDSLMVSFVKSPAVKYKEGLITSGQKMGKSPIQVEKDIWKKLTMNAKEATAFTLKNYLTSKTESLSDYKGKVVLLTYWFPGCGPCRLEFPHFENVLRKFDGKDVVYLGINIDPKQNEYVAPFVKNSGYSFTPLEDVPGRVKGNLDNRNGAPVNFLIDKTGRVIFSRFRTGAENEKDLELMISSLLKQDS